MIFRLLRHILIMNESVNTQHCMYSIGSLEEISQVIPSAGSVEIIRDFMATVSFKAFSSGEKRNLQNEITVAYISANGADDNRNILEAHRKYADLHFTITGTDLIAFKSIVECKKVCQPYNDEADYVLYNELPVMIYKIKQNLFCFIPPEYAHMALYGNCGKVEKLIFKIPVKLF